MIRSNYDFYDFISIFSHHCSISCFKLKMTLLRRLELLNTRTHEKDVIVNLKQLNETFVAAASDGDATIVKSLLWMGTNVDCRSVVRNAFSFLCSRSYLTRKVWSINHQFLCSMPNFNTLLSIKLSYDSSWNEWKTEVKTIHILLPVSL